jgi:hypothetical protein
MARDFARVFETLKPVLARQASRLVVKTDSPTGFNFKIRAGSRGA